MRNRIHLRHIVQASIGSAYDSFLILIKIDTTRPHDGQNIEIIIGMFSERSPHLLQQGRPMMLGLYSSLRKDRPFLDAIRMRSAFNFIKPAASF